MKMYISLCLFSLFAIVTCSSIVDRDQISIKSEWELFKSTHEKKYENADVEQHRLKIFIENKKKIEEHNELAKDGKKSYFLGMNRFGDLSHHEFVKMMNGYRASSKKLNTKTFSENVALPKVVDWRTKGYVTPVKDQGHCGSCWSFSATGALEGQHFKRTGNLVSLSEQNLIDCSRQYGNNGCNGGLMDNAFTYIKDNGGIDTENSYPYEATDDECRFNVSNVGATDTGHVDIPTGDEKSLQIALAKVGPISVAIDASHESFQFYSTGIYNEPSCSSYELDHGVLAVGYGPGYYLVKNSWGTSWGQQGYIQMSRHKNNQCGIATSASYPTVQ